MAASKFHLSACVISDTSRLHDRSVEKDRWAVLCAAKRSAAGSRMAFGVAARGPADHRARHPAGRVRLADWNALLQAAGAWPLGGAQRSHGQSHRSGDFCISDGEMVLLHGFEKKTQKTPSQDIELARMRKREIEK